MALKMFLTVHSTMLKNKLLANTPDLQTHKEGCANLQVFNEDVGPALRKLVKKLTLILILFKFTKQRSLIEKICLTCQQNLQGHFSLNAK